MTNFSLEHMIQHAQHLYTVQKLFCSEAVLKALMEGFQLPPNDAVLDAAAGFGSGMGESGCTCGAVSGAVLAFGLFWPRRNNPLNAERCLVLAGELHKAFKLRHKVVCCRVLNRGLPRGNPDRKRQCAVYVGEAVELAAQIIARELDNDRQGLAFVFPQTAEKKPV